MEHIYKKISLEEIRSRNAGTILSWDGTKTEEYNSSALASLPYKLNYGKFPSDIDISKAEEENSGFSFNIPALSGNTIISFNTLRKWYNWMTMYHQLLIPTNGCSSDLYKTVRERDEHEEEVPELKPYEDMGLDETYEYIGGDEMYRFLTERVFPCFIIPAEYIDEWAMTRLSLNEAMKKNAWFIECYHKYDGKEEKDVSAEELKNFKEYQRLGGKGMKEALAEFFTTLQFGKDTTFVDDSIRYDGVEFNSYFNIQIPLLNNVENFGDFSILYEDWDGGEDYSSPQGSISSGGTIVMYNDKDYIWSNENDGTVAKGSLYSSLYYENYFGSSAETSEYEQAEIRASFDKDALKPKNLTNQWERYIDAYVSAHSDEFNLYNNYRYAYKNGTLVLYRQDENPWRVMGDKLDVTTSSNNTLFFSINGGIFESDHIDFLEKKDEIYKVEYVTGTALKIPYIVIGNKTYYGIVKGKNVIFNIGTKCLSDASSDDIISGTPSNGHLLQYGGKWHKILNKKVTLKSQNCYEGAEGVVNVNGNSYITAQNARNEWHMLINKEDAATRKISGATECKEYGEYLQPSDISSTSSGYTSEGNSIYIITPYSECYVGKISGTTESKLKDYKDTVTYTDNLGNELLGSLVKDDGDIRYPKEGETLDLQYHVGNFSRDLSLIYSTLDEKRYNGGMITEIDIDVMLPDDTTMESKAYTVQDNDLYEYLCDVFSNESYKNCTVKCTVKYVGCATIQHTITSAEDKPLVSPPQVVDDSKYIRYEEEFYVTKLPQTFNITQCFGFVVYYFNLEPINGVAKFYLDDITDEDKPTAFPVFREEERLGLCLNEKVDGNIYFNRGMGQALSKQLKLMEVHSLKSLENYSNNEFTII